MNIAIFTDVFLPKIDGIVTSTIELATEFARQGHQVLIIAPKSQGVPDALPEKKIRLLYVPSLPSFMYPEMRMGFLSLPTYRAIKHFQPEIIHIVSPSTLGLFGQFVSSRLKVPSVGVFHVNFMKPEYLEIVGIRRGVRQVEAVLWEYARIFFAASEAVISPSQGIKKDLLGHGFRESVKVCPNGIKIDTQLSERTAANLQRLRQQYRLAGDKTLIYVGRLSKEKALDRLLRVFKLVLAADADVRLLLFGDGPIKAELEAYAQELGIDHATVFWGQVEHQRLLDEQLFRLGKIFCTCSTSEVQPMSMIEAMCFGLPVIVPDNLAMQELIQGNGFLVSPPDSEAHFCQKILTLLRDEALYQQLSTASLEASKYFRIEHSVTYYLEVFRDVVRGHNSVNLIN
ncbi:MAG: glycosyltransferase [Anaerolineae bacterium]